MGVAALLVLTATACESTIVSRINERRADAGQPELSATLYLGAQARQHSVSMP